MISSPCQGTSDTDNFCIKWQTEKNKKRSLLNILKSSTETDLLRKVNKQSDKIKKSK